MDLNRPKVFLVMGEQSEMGYSEILSVASTEEKAKEMVDKFKKSTYNIWDEIFYEERVVDEGIGN